MITTTETLTYEATETSLKRGDLKPDLVYYARDDSHEADLTQVASWRLIARTTDGTLVFDASTTAGTVAASTPDPEQPWRVALTHEWTAEETATARRLIVEAEAMWPGGKPQSFPRITVNIEPDLG